MTSSRIYRVNQPGWLEPGWYIRGREHLGPYETEGEALNVLTIQERVAALSENPDRERAIKQAIGLHMILPQKR